MAGYCHKNEVILTGTALAEPEYSHCNHEARFYKFPLRVLRLSGQEDELVIVVNESLLKNFEIVKETRVEIAGQLRSYNNRTGEGSKLVITVFAQNLRLGGEEDLNEIILTGALCKRPVQRSTPLGRDICDIMLAVNRPYGRADYIPCIAWGVLAEEIGALQVGEELSFEGRIQSRPYRKQTENGVESRVAYEVSVMCLL